MKTRTSLVLSLAVVALTLFGCTHHIARHGWETLIDGERGMENFSPSGNDANWRAAEGAIQADKATGKGSSTLVSKKSYKDFDLYTEFWSAEDTNSGIYIRIRNPANVSTSTGAYEIQIWDKNPNPAYATGSLVNVAEVKPIHKAAGKWNTFEIHAKGPEITVKMNGVVTVSARDDRFPEGRVGIQWNGGPIKIRKLLVREL
jgi:hypothetical protein